MAEDKPPDEKLGVKDGKPRERTGLVLVVFGETAYAVTGVPAGREDDAAAQVASQVFGTPLRSTDLTINPPRDKRLEN